MTKTFKPLLAATLEPSDFEKVRFPLMASPKLDGIRVIIKDGVAITRNLKPVRNIHVQNLFGRSDYNGLDGELIVGDPCDPLCYRNTNSGVMSESGEPNVKFYFFDHFGCDDQWYKRYDKACEQVRGANNFIKVEHKEIRSVEDLVSYEETCLELGYEGIMLRDPEGRYKTGRSTFKEQILLKLKRFTDFEAYIVGFQERMHNANEATINALGYTERSSHKENMVGRNDLGALWVCKTKGSYNFPLDNHKRQFLLEEIAKVVPKLTTREKLEQYNNSQQTHMVFTVGSGFTDIQRRQIWWDTDSYFGKMVTLRAFNYGGYDLPRFPTFVDFRSDI